MGATNGEVIVPQVGRSFAGVACACSNPGLIGAAAPARGASSLAGSLTAMWCAPSDPFTPFEFMGAVIVSTFALRLYHRSVTRTWAVGNSMLSTRESKLGPGAFGACAVSYREGQGEERARGRGAI